jgi:hypothetical protein
MSVIKFLRDLSEEMLRKVEQGFIAEIVSYDKEKMRAEIKPLLEYTTEASGKADKEVLETPNLTDIPCQILYAGGYYIRPNYAKGDKVNCELKSSNITKPLDSGIRADTGNNRFSLSFCVVTGGVIPGDFTAPAAWGNSDGLLIGNGDDLTIEILDDTLKIENDNGYLELKTDGKLALNGDADNAVAYTDLKSAFDTLKTDLNNFITVYNAHNHPTAPPGPVSVPSAPGVSSAADMSGAKVNEVQLP